MQNLFGKCVLVAMLAFGFVPAAQAQMALHSKIETKVKSSKKDATTIEFKVVPDKDLVINLEGPWSVTVDNAGKTTKVGVDKFNQKIPGFTTDVAVGKGVELKYTMVVFVCTSDKKTCYRDSHKGTVKT